MLLNIISILINHVCIVAVVEILVVIIGEQQNRMDVMLSRILCSLMNNLDITLHNMEHQHFVDIEVYYTNDAIH